MRLRVDLPVRVNDLVEATEGVREGAGDGARCGNGGDAFGPLSTGESIGEGITSDVEEAVRALGGMFIQNRWGGAGDAGVIEI